MMNIENVENAQTLAEAIVNTLPDPFLVLDDQFRVLAGSRPFYETFNVDPAQTHGCLLFALGSGQWDIPGLPTASIRSRSALISPGFAAA